MATTSRTRAHSHSHSRVSASTSRSAVVINDMHEIQTRPNMKLENTYKTKPDRLFPVAQVRRLVENVLRSHLDKKDYNASECQNLTLVLAGEIKNKVRALAIPRYKIVCFVVIGEKHLAAVNFTSRCLWDKEYDSFAEGIFKNGSIYATGVVYGIYLGNRHNEIPPPACKPPTFRFPEQSYSTN